MEFRDVIRFTLAIAAMLSAAAAGAQQLYKWTDANGVTNYSNQPPADRTVKNLRSVEDKVSVYTPDEALLQAIEDEKRNGGARRAQRERIEALESQLDAERRARLQAEAAASARAAAYEKCIAEGRLDCSAIYGYEPNVPAVIVAPRRPPRHPVKQHYPPPGTIAGNATAGNGVIPGHMNADKGKTAGTVTGIDGTMPGNSGSAPLKKASSRYSPYDRR